MKLPNGFGTVQKLSGKRRKPFQAMVTTGWTMDTVTMKPKQTRRTIGCYGTRSEALQALSDYNKNPFNIDNANITFAEVYERWSDEHFPTISNSNVQGYKAAYLLCRPIADKRMVDVKLDDLQFIADSSGKNTPTLRKYKVLCGMVFKYAVIHDIISKDANKVEYIDISKAGNPNALNRQPFTLKEIDKVWDWQQDNVYCNVILMLIYTGVRVSELLDLKKENVNLQEKWFDVTASKTDAGIRKVPISDKVFPFFEYWYNLNDCKYLLSTPDGKHFEYRNYYDSYWKPVIKAMNMKHTPHDTRHTCVSLLAEAGVDERMIQKIVGHKGHGVTQVVYTHFEINALLDAINKI